MPSFSIVLLSLMLAAPEGAAVAGTQDIPIVGGYSNISISREDVQEAAQFAAGELGFELAGIESAKSKAVAAVLFQLELTGADGSRWRVEVTKPLRGGSWSLMSSQQLEAAGEVNAQYD